MDLLISDSKDALFISQLKVLNDAMSRAQQELASGKRILNASDDPGSVPAIVQNQADLARVEQSQSNLNTLNSEVGMASSDLENAATIMDNISSIGAEGATGTTDAQTRQMLAGQVQDLETQIVGIANSTNEGRYLFGGDDDSTAPYSIDFANTPPFTANTTAQATRMGIDAMGNTFSIAMTATDIFNNADPTQNILQSIENLRQGLLNNDSPAIATAVTQLSTADQHLSSVQAYYGNAQSTITSALNTASTMQLNLQTQQSQLTDADQAQVITTEQTAQTQQQAMLEMRAQMPRGSLFDMLA
jgi:flagellar hook-associated protein 3 FlgL